MPERHAETGLAHPAASLAEGSQLLGGIRVGRRVFDVGEVRREPFDDDARDPLSPAHETDDLLAPHALAVSPRFHLDVDAGAAPRPGGRWSEPLEGLLVVNGEAQVARDRLGQRGERDVAEDKDRSAEARVPEGEALFERVDAQLVRTGRGNDPGDLNKSVAVGVGLDDRQQPPPRTEQPAELGEVMNERGPADLDPLQEPAPRNECHGARPDRTLATSTKPASSVSRRTVSRRATPVETMATRVSTRSSTARR